MSGSSSTTSTSAMWALSTIGRTSVTRIYANGPDGLVRADGANDRRHAVDRLVQADVAGRPEELGVAEGEDASVGRRQPVAVARRRDGHADDRLVQLDVA